MINTRTLAIIGRKIIDRAMGTNYATQYTKTGSNGTVTNSNGSQLITGGAGSWLDRVVCNIGYIFAKQCSFSIDVKAVADGMGLGVGFNTAIVSGALDLTGYMDMTTNKGKIFLGQLSGSTFTSAADSGSDVLSYVNGDIIRHTIIVNRRTNSIMFQVRNMRTDKRLSVTRTNTYVSIAKFAYYILGGTQSINNLVSDNDAPQTKVCFVGDSVMNLPTDGAYPDLIGFESFDSISNYGVSGTTSADLLLYIQALLDLNADIYFLGHGANDVKQGVSTATFIANQTAIRNILIAAGKTVYFLYIAPFDVGCPAGQNADIDAKNAAMVTAFGANVFDDTYRGSSTSGGSSTSVLAPSKYSGDGSFAHFNATGATDVKNLLKVTLAAIIKF